MISQTTQFETVTIHSCEHETTSGTSRSAMAVQTLSKWFHMRNVDVKSLTV